MKTLNEIPVLDKGYVALFSSSMSREELLHVKRFFFKNQITDQLLSKVHLHAEIKCPLFVQLSLSEQLSTTTKAGSKLEAFIPAVNDVKAADLETSEMIAKDIEQTTEALLLNPKAYQMDGCDIFISQMISPISVYNTVLVSGSLKHWINYANQKGLPAPIEEYRKVIEHVIRAEYDFLWELFDAEKKQGKARR